MSHEVDNEWCRRQIVWACRGHDSLERAEVAGIYVDAVRDQIIEHCIPYAIKMRERIVHLPAMSRVDPKDLESAALWGLTEGVSCYRLSKGVLLTTHVTNWIRKRVLEARDEGHWAISKPPKALAADYMTGRLEGAEREAYIDTFVRQCRLPWEETDAWQDPVAEMGMHRGGRT